MANSRNVVFVGPTYAPVSGSGLIERAGFELRPPAGRGDIEALGGERPGVIVLVDGRFNQSLSVGHAELRRVVDQGWAVWGLSSMGAIRAFEMRHLGMRGFGRVYEHFLGADDFQDDEVALVHAPDEPYTALTEPLVHVRYCLAKMERDGELTHRAAQRVVDELKSLWFAERTLEALVVLVNRFAGAASAVCITRCVQDFESFRVKTTDLIAFFSQRPWIDGTYRAQPTLAPYHP